MGKNQEIERLRAIAILLVFITHTSCVSSLLPELLKYSWVGVDLFFVISGYVVSRSLQRLLPDLRSAEFSSRFSLAAPSLRTFYLRRVFRILPLAFLWMTLSLLLAFLFRITDPQMFGTVQQIVIENIYFCSGVFNYLRDNTTVQGQLWSLAVEEHFYLLLPLLLVIAPTRSSRVAVALAGMLLVICVLRPFIPVPAGADPVSFLTYTSHRRFDQLFMGVLLGLLQDDGSGESQPLGFASKSGGALWQLGKLSLATFLVLLLWASPGAFSEHFRLGFGFTIYGLIGMALVFLASRQQGFIFELPVVATFLEFVGARSYSLYMCHVPMGRLHLHLMKANAAAIPEWVTGSVAGRLLQFAALLLFNCAVAEITYRILERPLIRLGHRVTQRREPQLSIVGETSRPQMAGVG